MITVESLDKKWSKCIQLKWRGLDTYSPKVNGKFQEGEDPHHVISKNRGRAVRWDLRNGVWLKRFTHTKIHSSSKEHEKFIEWFRDIEEGYDELLRLASSNTKIYLDEVNDVLDKYLSGHT